MNGKSKTAFEPENLGEFKILDYVVFAGMLVGCALIGIYHAFKGRKKGDHVNEYLMGGRNMKTFPVAMSLVASCISGISLLGVPTEIYLYGTEYALIIIPLTLTAFIASYLFLPVFHEMQLYSTYEYLEIRFDKNVRLLGSLLFTVAQICWLPIVIYIPALAFNQVTGVNIHVVTPCVCLICIFYTCLGGLKAVVWTDVVQTWFMIASMILVCVKGSLDIGGFDEVWRRSSDGGRLILPTFSPDPTIRHTFWSITIGGAIMWIQYSVINQNVLQRYLALPTLGHARCLPDRAFYFTKTHTVHKTVLQIEYTGHPHHVKPLLKNVVYQFLSGIGELGVIWALFIFLFGTSSLLLVCCYAGLLTYATYHDCDPLKTQVAKAKDQLLPLLVMRVLSNWSGLPGLFVAGVFSASLSSLSTGLNSMSAVVLEDFVRLFLKKELTNRQTCLILRGTTIGFGAFLLVLVMIVEKLGTVLQLSISLGSVTSGPLLGTFICGIFLPWINGKGALFGGLLGLFGSGFVIIGAQNAIGSQRLKFIPLPTSVEGCQYYHNATLLLSASQTAIPDNTVFPLFKMSYFWYTAFGCLLTILLSFAISALTGFTDFSSLDPICFSPVVRNCLPKTKLQALRCEEQELINSLKKGVP